MKEAGAMEETFSVKLSELIRRRPEFEHRLKSELGLSPSKLKRWLRGTSRPTSDELASLRRMGMKNIGLGDSKSEKTPILDLRGASGEEGGKQRKIAKGLEIQPSPYVTNGPNDQAPFFSELFELQALGLERMSVAELAPRLTAAAAVVGYGPTLQARLERSKSTARHWNSNYGPHGWHRYVGRFPPHLVRAVFNHFGLAPGSKVLDPFLGSGTTLVEARLLGMHAIGMDVCPLSCLISRVKAQFPENSGRIESALGEYEKFYADEWAAFTKKKRLDHKNVLGRKGNPINVFANVEKWFTPEALLGVSITVEFLLSKRGYTKDLFACALSSAMRSIGNLDVDVVRAEYSKSPRQNVDVKKLVVSKVKKFVRDIAASIETHRSLLGAAEDVEIKNESLLDSKISPNSIDCIVTSPPYGVEALSYLRTHLLSYRSLERMFKYDPYSDCEKIIGSEYLPKKTQERWACSEISQTFKFFFEGILNDRLDPKLLPRAHMMMKFFEDMSEIASRFAVWLKPNGGIAFVVGNKRLGEEVIPTAKIIEEIFQHFGLLQERVIKHKLKTNNSNSEVPWQENIIQDEYMLLFRKVSN